MPVPKIRTACLSPRLVRTQRRARPPFSFGSGTPIDGRALVKAIFPAGPGMNVAELTAGTAAGAKAAMAPVRRRRRSIVARRYIRFEQLLSSFGLENGLPVPKIRTACRDSAISPTRCTVEGGGERGRGLLAAGRRLDRELQLGPSLLQINAEERAALPLGVTISSSRALISGSARKRRRCRPSTRSRETRPARPTSAAAARRASSASSVERAGDRRFGHRSVLRVGCAASVEPQPRFRSRGSRGGSGAEHRRGRGAGRHQRLRDPLLRARGAPAGGRARRRAAPLRRGDACGGLGSSTSPSRPGSRSRRSGRC